MLAFYTLPKKQYGLLQVGVLLLITFLTSFIGGSLYEHLVVDIKLGGWGWL